MLEKLNAVVIKNIRYGEADRILTVFTKEKGKIKIMAKGAMSKRRNIMAQTQTFAVSSFVLYPGKTFHTIKSADFIKTFPGIQTDIERLAYASYLCELVDIFYEEEVAEEITFHLILYYLDFIQGQSLDKLPFIILSFMIKLLGISGILPDFTQCNACGENDAGMYYLDIETAEFTCEKCTENRAKLYPLDKGQVSAVNAFRTMDLRDIPNIRMDLISPEKCQRLIVMFNNYISCSLMKKTNSFRMLKDMMQL